MPTGKPQETDVVGSSWKLNICHSNWSFVSEVVSAGISRVSGSLPALASTKGVGLDGLVGKISRKSAQNRASSSFL